LACLIASAGIASFKVAAFAALARDHDALLYLDDAHGFGVVGERVAGDETPYGRRGNGVVRHAGESCEHIVLTGGFSKAYSSLLAFVACPPQLKRLLKVTAPPYLYSGIPGVAGRLAGQRPGRAPDHRGPAGRSRRPGRRRALPARPGIYVTLAFYPGVPRDEVGFRVQVTAANTDDEVDELLAALDRLVDVVPLRAA
jgi:8-amino-7-oxononanoate synthase